MVTNNAWVVIADANNPTPAGVVAIFHGPTAEADGIEWRDANKPGYGVVPCYVQSVNLIESIVL